MYLSVSVVSPDFVTLVAPNKQFFKTLSEFIVYNSYSI